MREAREDLNNHFKLQGQRMEQQFNQTLPGNNDNTKGGTVRMVGLPTLPNEEGDHIGNDVDELSKVGKIHN